MGLIVQGFQRCLGGNPKKVEELAPNVASIKKTINLIKSDSNSPAIIDKVCQSLDQLCNAWKSRLLTRDEFEDLYKLLLENTRLSKLTPEDLRQYSTNFSKQLGSSSKAECYRSVLGMPHSKYLKARIELGNNLIDFLIEYSRVYNYMDIFPESTTYHTRSLLRNVRI